MRLPVHTHTNNSRLGPKRACSCSWVSVLRITLTVGANRRISNSWNRWSQMLYVTSSMMNMMTASGLAANFHASIIPEHRPLSALFSGI